jgi:hypothetical protein
MLRTSVQFSPFIALKTEKVRDWLLHAAMPIPALHFVDVSNQITTWTVLHRFREVAGKESWFEEVRVGKRLGSSAPKGSE